MKIAIIGATGYVGSAILNEALERDHEITAIVRHPEKLAPHLNLNIRGGDVLNDNELTDLIAGHDVVISAFNAFQSGISNEDGYRIQITGTNSLIDAVKKSGIKRLLVVGGAGSLEVQPGTLLVNTPGFPAEWKGMALAMTEVLEILKNKKELNWTLLSPSAQLQPGTRTGIFKLGKDQLLLDINGESKISTQDYAVAMLDELENPQHEYQRFTVGYE